jgi:hypothetical protein
MLCLINILTRVVNAYLFAGLLLFNLVAAVLSIYYGNKIKDELALQAFSKFLQADIEYVASIAGIVAGSFILLTTVLGGVLISPF